MQSIFCYGSYFAIGQDSIAMQKLLILTLLVLPLAASAQIYRTTDEHGNEVFTDSPPPGSSKSQRVDIQQTNTIAPPPSRPAPAAPQAPEPEPVAYSVSIIEPANETSFPMGPGNFSVIAEVTPALTGDNALQLHIDGIPWGQPQRDTTWALTNIFRGAHDLTVQVIDTEGQSLATSSAIRVFVHRPSVNFRNRN
jgi:hypothetical protein